MGDFTLANSPDTLSPCHPFARHPISLSLYCQDILSACNPIPPDTLLPGHPISLILSHSHPISLILSHPHPISLSSYFTHPISLSPYLTHPISPTPYLTLTLSVSHPIARVPRRWRRGCWSWSDPASRRPRSWSSSTTRRTTCRSIWACSNTPSSW